MGNAPKDGRVVLRSEEKRAASGPGHPRGIAAPGLRSEQGKGACELDARLPAVPVWVGFPGAAMREEEPEGQQAGKRCGDERGQRSRTEGTNGGVTCLGKGIPRARRTGGPPPWPGFRGRRRNLPESRRAPRQEPVRPGDQHGIRRRFERLVAAGSGVEIGEPHGAEFVPVGFVGTRTMSSLSVASKTLPSAGTCLAWGWIA